MKSIIRSFIYNIFCLYFASIIIPGFQIKGDIKIILLGGAALTILNLFLKPIAKILFFPINLVTLGLFSWVINVIIMYILMYFLPQIAARDFVFNGFSLNGFTVPSIYFSKLLTIILVSFFISFFSGFLNWARK